MKKTAFIIVAFLALLGALTAQQPKKNTKPAQPKTETEEINEALKEAQREMENMTPEERAEMEKMGIKMPKDLTKIVPGGASDENLDKMEKEANAVIESWRKEAIAAMPKKLLTDAEMKTYLQRYLETVERKISTKAKANAQKTYNDGKAKGWDDAKMQNAATFLWMKKSYSEALWLWAKLATQSPQDLNLLNNLAAASTLLGGGHFALPILQRLNRDLPNSTVILNNTGQAWCDLGVADSTKKYLTLALAKDPDNCNANYTLATILHSEGKTEEADTLLRRSIKNGFSGDKARLAEKWGIKLTPKDISWIKPKEDILGLRRIQIPGYAHSTDDSPEVKQKWDDLQQSLAKEGARLNKQAEKLLPVIESKKIALQQKMLLSKDPTLMIPPFAEKAALFSVMEQDAAKQRLLTYNEKNPSPIDKFRKKQGEDSGRFIKSLEKQYPKCPGEGCNHSAWCPIYREGLDKINSEYVAKCNNYYLNFNQESVEFAIASANATANMALYVSNFHEEIEYANLLARGEFYTMLAELEHVEIAPIANNCGLGSFVPRGDSVELPSLHDLNCPATFQIGIGVAKFKYDCQKIAMEGGEGIIGSFERDLKTGQTEFGFGIGAQWHMGQKGIVSLDAGAKEMIIVQTDARGNFTDCGYKFSAGAELTAGVFTSEGEVSLKNTMQTGVTWGHEGTLGIKTLSGK